MDLHLVSLASWTHSHSARGLTNGNADTVTENADPAHPRAAGREAGETRAGRPGTSASDSDQKYMSSHHTTMDERALPFHT